MTRSKITGQVYRYDFDRAMSARFAPHDKRHGLLLLSAFDFQLAKIRHQTGEALLRRIRLQFWRDALADGQGGGLDLANELVECFAGIPSMSGLLDDLLQIHEEFVEEPNSAAVLWHEYNARQGGLFRLATEFLEPSRGRVLTDFFKHCGTAYGGILQLCQRRPGAQQSADERVHLLKETKQACTAFSRDADLLPEKVLPGILPMALILPYLHLYQQSDKSVATAIDLNPVKKQWFMWRIMRKGF